MQRKRMLLNERGNKFSNAYILHNNTCDTLVSYTTPVCKIFANADHTGWVFERIAYGNSLVESRTTMRHINCFRRDYNMPSIGVAEWRKM